MIQAAGAYGINVLEADQQDIALVFARKGENKFVDVDWRLDHGLPRIEGVGSWLACTVEQIVEGGDHQIVIGRVEHADHDARQPLLYQRSAFGTLAAGAV
jgi:flavin reductase (DIM6/NTAB) family NADH-FMN oxidoreductase RutF